MMALIDIVRISVLSFISMFGVRRKYPARSWSTELTFRLAKRLLRESVGKPISWLRARQNLLTLFSPALLNVTKTKTVIAGVKCSRLVPKSVADPTTVIVYLHGGGYVVGSPAYYNLTMAKIALASKACVIGVDYRLAPEHALPAAQDDCLAVTKALLASSSNQGDEQLKNKKIILMGDSAGAALCLSVIKRLSKEVIATSSSRNKVDACVLISPWLAAMDQTKLELAHEESDMLDRVILKHWTETILKDKSILTDKAQQAEHLDFTEMDVSVLPPVYIQSAGAEVFNQQVLTFAERLKLAKVDYKHDVFDQQFHVFQTLSPLVREANNAILKIGTFVKSVRGKGST